MSPTALYRALLLAAGIVLAALLVEQLMTLLLALSVTVIIALPLEAAASWAQRRGIPRMVGALGALGVTFALLGALGAVLLPQFARQVSSFAGGLPELLKGAGRHVQIIGGLRVPNVGAEMGRFVEGYTRHPERLAGTAMELGLGLLGLAVAFALMLFVAVIAAVNPRPLVSGVLRLIPAAHQPAAREVLTRVREAWLRWQLAVALDMLVLGSLLFVGLSIVGLPFALGFAMFSAFLTVIPNYGSIISAAPPIVVGLAESPTKALLVLLVYIIVNQVEGNLILPLIMARTVDMHPALVTLGLLAVGALFGLIGVVIAIPLLSLAIILVEVLWIEPSEARANARASAPPRGSEPEAAR